MTTTTRHRENIRRERGFPRIDFLSSPLSTSRRECSLALARSRRLPYISVEPLRRYRFLTAALSRYTPCANVTRADVRYVRCGKGSLPVIHKALSLSLSLSPSATQRNVTHATQCDVCTRANSIRPLLPDREHGELSQSVLVRLSVVVNPMRSDRFFSFFLVFSVRDYLQLLRREFEFPE